MAASARKVKLKIYLDDEQLAAEILVSSATKCTSIVQRLQRQLHAQECFLVEVWQGCERLVPDGEKILLTLVDWGSDLEDVRFYVRCKDSSIPQASQMAAKHPGDSQDFVSNCIDKNHVMDSDMFQKESRSTLAELQELAVKQHKEIAAKGRELKIREQRLYTLKRVHKKPGPAYVRQLEEEVEERNNKLKKLWQMQDEVQTYKLSNGVLAEELVKIRDLFSAREKELAVAVAKVNSLTQQLEEQRKCWGHDNTPAHAKTEQEIELARLREELMMRNELNHQQSVQLQAQKQLLAEKHKQLFDLDSQIETLSAEVRRKRVRGETVVEKQPNDQESEEKAKEQPAVTWRGQAPRPRGGLPRPLEPLLEEEEGVSDGSVSDTGSGGRKVSSPTRVGKLKSFFEESGAADHTFANRTMLVKREFSQTNGECKSPEGKAHSRENGENYVKDPRVSHRGRLKNGVADGKNKRDLSAEFSSSAETSSGEEPALRRGANWGKNGILGERHDTTTESDSSTSSLSELSSASVIERRGVRDIMLRTSPVEKVKKSGRGQSESTDLKRERETRSPPATQTRSVGAISTAAEISTKISTRDRAQPNRPPLPGVTDGEWATAPTEQHLVENSQVHNQGAITEAGDFAGEARESSGRARTEKFDVEASDRRDLPDCGSVRPTDNARLSTFDEDSSPGNVGQNSFVEWFDTPKVGPFEADNFVPSIATQASECDGAPTNDLCKQTDDFKQLHKRKQITRNESPQRSSVGFSSHVSVGTGGRPLVQTSRNPQIGRAAFLSMPSNATEVGKTRAVKRSPLLGNKRRTFKSSSLVKSASGEVQVEGDTVNASDNENVRLDGSSEEEATAFVEEVYERIEENETEGNTVISSRGADELRSEALESHVQDGLGKAVNDRPLEGERSFGHFPRSETQKVAKSVVTSVKIQLSKAAITSNGKLGFDALESKTGTSEVLNARELLVDVSPVENESAADEMSDMDQDSDSSVSEGDDEREDTTSEISIQDTNMEEVEDNNFPRKSAFRKIGGLGRDSRHVMLDPHVVLLDAAVEGDLGIVKNVISKVEDPSEPNQDGISALHNAICANHQEVVRFLVESGCDVNLPDSHGWTPLHCAAANNNLDTVQYLLEHGACVFASTALEKKTPYQCCDRGFPGYIGCSKFLFDVHENFGLFNSGHIFALYSYDACADDELSFDSHEELTVIRRGDETERDWWWAENGRGETGYIPKNLFGICPRVSPEV